MSWRAVLVAASAVLCAGALQAETLDLALLTATEGVDPVGGRAVIQLSLTPEARAVFSGFTVARIGKQVFVSLDGVVLASPVVMTVITDGTLVLTEGDDGFDGQSISDFLARLKEAGTITVSD